MENLDDVIANICELKGNLLTIESTLNSLIQVLPLESTQHLHATLEREIEAAKVVFLNSERIGEATIAAYERHAQRQLARFPADPT